MKLFGLILMTVLVLAGIAAIVLAVAADDGLNQEEEEESFGAVPRTIATAVLAAARVVGA